MGFVKKLFGLDNSEAKRLAEQQAKAMMEQAEATKRQSQAIADQQAQQTRLASERQRVEEQVRSMQEANRPEEVEVDIGSEGDEEPSTRRRRAYQNPSAGASGAVRI